jgi:hypothetical protein
MASNAEQLHQAGVTTSPELPDAYKQVVEGLSQQEVDAIVSAKKRLDDAHASTRDASDAPGHYREFFVAF